MDDVRPDIAKAITSRYGRPESPRFDFVDQIWRSKPYEAIIARLSGHGIAVVEKTDLNEDVAFTYELSQGDDLLVLQLSMVGPYAILLRDMAGSSVALTSREPRLSSFERTVLATVADSGLEFLDEATLSVPIPLQLNYVDPADTTVYQALFSDVELLPWANA
jgi:hypothetical protein